MVRALLVLAFVGGAGCAKPAEPEPDPFAAKQPEEPKKGSPQKGVPPAPVPPAPAADYVWAKAGVEPATIGDVRVEIINVEVTYSLSNTLCVEVIWLATTDNPARKYEYWGGSSHAVIKDEFDNRYKELFVKYHIEAESRYSDKLLARKKVMKELQFDAELGGVLASDRAKWGKLYFDRPVPAAKDLKLAISGQMFLLDGYFRFQIDPESLVYPPKKKP